MNSENTRRSDRTSRKDDFDIQPVVYSFRVQGRGPASGSVTTAVRPPHWLYHDHALGVIWKLFRNDQNYVGISQLQWCLRFLSDLKNSQGQYTGDVNICIQTVQDHLIDRYAKLGTIMEKTVEKTSRITSQGGELPVESIPTIVKQEKEEIMENESESSDANESIVIKQEKESMSSIEQDQIDSTIDPREELEENTFVAGVGKGITGTSTPIEEEEPKKVSGKHEGKTRTKHSKEHCNPTRCGTSERSKEKEEIVSFTYNEMIASGPAPCTESYSLDDLLDERKLLNGLDEKTTPQAIRDEDSTKMDLANASTKEMMDFLNSSRLEHIERIKKELEELHELERSMMEKLHGNEFPAYVADDSVNRLGYLQNEDVVKEADEIIK